jgi:PKD repeat protein
MRSRHLQFLILSIVLLAFSPAGAQVSLGGTPVSYSKGLTLQPLAEVNVGIPDFNQVAIEDARDAKEGTLYKIARILPVNLTPQNSGVWEVLPDGSRLWRLKIKSEGALALFLTYNHFVLPEGASMFLYNGDMSHIAGAYNHTTNPPASNPEFSTRIMDGDVTVIEVHMPMGVTSDPVLEISGVGHIYRGYKPRAQAIADAQRINESDACQVNVNCVPEGNNWQDEKRGVVRILVRVGSSAGWCSGSLINNTAQDCRRFVLTADHCAGGGGSNPTYSTTTNLNQWQFYFNYESPNCSNPSVAGTLDDYVLTGCVRRAQGGNGGDQGSDFYLIEITPTIPAGWNAYYNGWNRSTTASTSGVSIHHPSGDIKKISTYTTTLVNSGWNGSGLSSHWRVIWAATSNGHGVTEGGSSGSPIFNASGHIVGQLTGGASYCTATGQPDFYGKMSYNWTSNTVPSTNNQLAPWLDPGNTGVTSLNGVYAPCSPQAPVADFSANNTAPCIGSTVQFTDQSSNQPTSWAWTFSPTTVTYVGATSSTSQNPQVQFNAAGNYTVTLVATNAQGNDSEVKTAYIAVTSGGALPYSQNFEGTTFPPAGITVLNPDNGSVAWGTDGAKGFVRRTATGNTGSASGCAGINYFNYNVAGGPTDALVIQPLSLVGATNPTMTFKRAYRYYNNPTYYDELRVFVSTDCGATYGSAVYTKTGTQLATSGTLNTTFSPGAAGDWDIDTVNLAAYVGQTVVIKIEGTSRYGNNLYIDDINIASSVLTAGVSISTSSTSICSGQSATFTATPTNGGTSPSYQWRKNGGNVGTNSPTYTDNALVNGNVITCIMTSNLPGVTGNPATSNAITMTVNATVTPSVSITANPGNAICSGQNVTFTATPVNGGTSPSYQWRRNGSNVGSNSATFSSTALVNGDVITVVMTSNAPCASPTTATSNAITMTVNATPATPTITQNGTTLTSSSATGNQWYFNGSPIAGATSQTHVATQTGNYTVVVTQSGCASLASSPVNVTSLSIEDLILWNSFFVYPNPNDGLFTLQFESAVMDDFVIEVRNPIGQIVYSESLGDFSGRFQRNLDLQGLGKGVYFLTLRNSSHESVKRVVIL